VTSPCAGQLNRRLVYEEPADGTPDTFGQVPETFATVATVWASVRTPTGRELLNAGQLQAVVSHSVTVRRARGWFPKATGRFVYSSPAYNATNRALNVVAAFDPDEGNQWVTCLCAEKTEPGEVVT
jgi:head-tail adaptor